MKAELFLSNWSDILGESNEEKIIDYNTLLASDDEYLILESIFFNAKEMEDQFYEWRNNKQT